MANIDKTFIELCNTIVSKGREYENKNRGVKRLQVPSFTLAHDLSKGFPAITNKKLPFKFVKGELIWFLRGDTNIKYLVDSGIPIWNKDAYNLYVKVASGNHDAGVNNYLYMENSDGSFRMMLINEFVELIKLTPTRESLVKYYSFGEYTLGDVGQNYSAQWRNFNGVTDQIKDLIDVMKSDIMSSRLKVNAWNPSETELTALPPCHSEFQVIGVPLTIKERLEIFKKGSSETVDASGAHSTISQYLKENGIPEFGFELHWNQRSVDTFLGLPFNIASYGLLTKIFEEITSYPALGIEGTLKCVHFYDNQYEAVTELLSRDIDAHENCELIFSENFKIQCKDFREGRLTLDELFQAMSIDSFKLKGYTSDEEIKAEMLAPTKI